MRTRPTPALAASALTLAAGLVLAGCSRSDDAPESAATTPPAATEKVEGSGGDFCAAYDEAGGTLATLGPFQVAMPPEETLADLGPRIEVLEAVSPPDDIAAEWQTLHDLYTEAVTIAEQTPDDGVVAGPRIFEIVEELDAPGSTVLDYLTTTC
ncbi:hypothetical protein Cch01nite_13670 [Cellulomonas chitinilytica]|uniref:Lipoprotein n=1 Tax=Cellulomonas chitinilytica TaxID=398759 RepID=A0A919NZQ4_9CELL|nr:hypothetical protein [Cellulomonas chitinilytica]GIG20643.1 hypothetical protein Cch01nite_13670 [Cellulomonas chitinilytica]